MEKSIQEQGPSLSSWVKIPDNILCRELDGELVVLNLARGTYFSLNPVGTRIWQLIQTGNGQLEAVLHHLLEEFAVDEQLARTDLLALVSSLQKHELVALTAAPNS